MKLICYMIITAMAIICIPNDSVALTLSEMEKNNAAVSFEKIKKENITFYLKAGGGWWNFNSAINDVPVLNNETGKVAYIDGNDYLAILKDFKKSRGEESIDWNYYSSVRKLNWEARAYEKTTIFVLIFATILFLFIVIMGLRNKVEKNFFCDDKYSVQLLTWEDAVKVNGYYGVSKIKYLLCLLFILSLVATYLGTAKYGLGSLEELIQKSFASDAIFWVVGGLFIGIIITEKVDSGKVLSSKILVARLVAFFFGVKNTVMLPALIIIYFFIGDFNYVASSTGFEIPHWLSCVSGSSGNCNAYGVRTRLMEIPLTILFVFGALGFYIWASIAMLGWSLNGWFRIGEGWVRIGKNWRKNQRY